MSMYPIASYTFTAQSATPVTFSNIPQNFTHLEIRTTNLLSNGASGTVIQFNGDASASSYAVHRTSANGSGAGSDSFVTGSIGGCWGYAARSITLSSATYPAFVISTILDYTSASKNKVVRSFYGVDKNGSGEVGMGSGLWVNTAPVTSITMTNYAGGDWFAGTRYDLYGILSSSATGA